jgi:SAM-dependent methyltransferase
MTTPLEQIKKRQHATWSSGAYGRIAWLTVPLADTLCEAVDLRPGASVLDVATGTGHVALAAARRFCRTTGIDYLPDLLDQARARAAAEDLDIAFREADAEDLPFEGGFFDYVLSVVGVMFTADHQRAAGELVRVCRPGGRIGMLNWTPTGFLGDLLKLVGGYAPPPPGALPPTRWGTPDAVRDLLGAGASDLTSTTGTVTMRFPSADFFADFLIEHYGPTVTAAERLSGEDRQAFRDDLAGLAAAAGRRPDGTFVHDWQYLVTVATTAGRPGGGEAVTLRG